MRPVTYVTTYEIVTLKDGALDYRWVVWRVGLETGRSAVAIAGTMAEANSVAAERIAA